MFTLFARFCNHLCSNDETFSSLPAFAVTFARTTKYFTHSTLAVDLQVMTNYCCTAWTIHSPFYYKEASLQKLQSLLTTVKAPRLASHIFCFSHFSHLKKLASRTNYLKREFRNHGPPNIFTSLVTFRSKHAHDISGHFPLKTATCMRMACHLKWHHVRWPQITHFNQITHF